MSRPHADNTPDTQPAHRAELTRRDRRWALAWSPGDEPALLAWARGPGSGMGPADVAALAMRMGARVADATPPAARPDHGSPIDPLATEEGTPARSTGRAVESASS